MNSIGASSRALHGGGQGFDSPAVHSRFAGILWLLSPPRDVPKPLCNPLATQIHASGCEPLGLAGAGCDGSDCISRPRLAPGAPLDPPTPGESTRCRPPPVSY